MARPSSLSDPEYAKAVAEAFADGWTREDMATAFAVNVGTITIWRRDPRIKAHYMKIIEDRVLRITRKTDAIIERRLQDAEKMDTETLLKIRKEFLGGALRNQTEKADAETVNEVMGAIEENPELMDDIIKLATGDSGKNGSSKASSAT